MKGVQHFLLSYAERPVSNVSIRVDNVKRRETGNQAELVLDVLVLAERQPGQSGSAPRHIPVQFELNGVRSTIDLELDSQGASLQGHRIPIDRRLRSGWGSVSVPEDSNALDNRFYFVFSEPTQRRAVIVSDDERTANAFQLALNVPLEQGVENLAEFIPSSRLSEIDWQATSLLIWQAPLPSGLVAEQIQQFVNSGRVAMFFPPGQKDDGQLFGAKWGQWQKLSEEEQRKLSWWRADADLPAMSQSTSSITWTPPATGDYRLTLQVPKDAKELLVDNNAVSAPIAIRQEKLKVLVIESYPRWEYRYLRNALERDPGVDVTCLLFHPELPKVGGGRGYIKTFPSTNELSRFDVVFVGDVGIGPQQLSEQQAQELRQLVSAQAAGLVFLPGRYGFQETLNISAFPHRRRRSITRGSTAMAIRR
jgi:hypothetical protein